MDKERVFRVLQSLQGEADPFLVAQIIDQMDELPATVAEFNVANMDDPFSYHDLIERAEELMALSEELRAALQSLQLEAAGFWLCAPVDDTESKQEGAASRWLEYSSQSVLMAADLKKRTASFQDSIKSLLDIPMFCALKERCAEEEAWNRANVGTLKQGEVAVMNDLSFLVHRKLFEHTNGAYHISFKFPTTHYSFVDARFSRLLEYSTARLLAAPISQAIVSRISFDKTVKELNSKEQPSKCLLSYRSATRKIITVHWEIASELVNETVMAIGIDVSRQMASNQARYDGNMQKILRQWLHSIRNASFEQQAELLLADFMELKDVVNDPMFDSQFNSLCDGLKTIIHTAKTSIGLIDQALDTKGLVQLVSVTDFLNTLTSFPVNFARSEGIGELSVKSTYYLNGIQIVPVDASKLFVKCDMVNIQAFVDNIVSNAVRYTDPTLGVEIRVEIDKVETMVRFRVRVQDYCPGGLPSDVFDFLKRRVGAQCLEVQTPLCSSAAISPLSETREVEVAPSAIKHFSDFREGNGNEVSSLNRQARLRATNLLLRQSDMKIRPPLVPPAIPSFIARALGHEHSMDSIDLPDTSPSSPRIDSVRADSPSNSSQSRSLNSTPGGRLRGAEVRASGKGRSSGTGLPHLLELYQQLTTHGEDFEFICSTGRSGSIMTIVFNGHLNQTGAETGETGALARSDIQLDGTLLVVDDSAVIRKIIFKHLETLNVDFHMCKDGVEAAEWFLVNSQKCCAIITDLEMPRMGGDALIARALEIRPEIPCFIVSGISVDKLPIGVRRAVIKPVSLEHITSMLEEVMNTQQAGATNK